MQRKTFRIEQMMTTGERRRAAPPAHDLIALHDIVTRHRQDLSALIHDGEHRRMTLAAGELGAAGESMEKATNDILKSAEGIDAQAQKLSAASDDSVRALSRSIQNQVAEIYEACNFQDLAGQRIGKVIELLGMVERHLSAMLTPADAAASSSAKSEDRLLNGPKLDGASGHISQHEIDQLFS
ncbi:protein phosphatase CheZ [Microbacteriaceae bacterium K1510]|nr:protein phosphatase CheZ [Microbacteriaceae bacterium K1510]